MKRLQRLEKRRPGKPLPDLSFAASCQRVRESQHFWGMLVLTTVAHSTAAGVGNPAPRSRVGAELRPRSRSPIFLRCSLFLPIQFMLTLLPQRYACLCHCSAGRFLLLLSPRYAFHKKKKSCLCYWNLYGSFECWLLGLPLHTMSNVLTCTYFLGQKCNFA